MGKVAWYSQLANRLRQSKSPYLQGHKNNPVAWQDWSPETLALAKDLNRPIFLSIGYHSCHWCHVMNRESFSNETVAEAINDNFVPVKVDKEEWPDLDHIYMMYLQASYGQGGWPLNVFLTPESLEPFFGGTYWAGPDVGSETQMGNAIPMLDVLKAVDQQWRQNEQQCRESAAKTVKSLASLVDSKSSGGSIELDKQALVSQIENSVLGSFDKEFGGYTAAPKFPMGHMLRFILASRKNFSPEVGESAEFTLKKILQGGIKDQVGNGISRYSVSRDWFLPHFEKMLYDQALLLQACLESDTEPAQELADDLCQYLISGPQRVDGLWVSGVDADSMGEDGRMHEGGYYTWTMAEFEKVFSQRPLFDADINAMYYGVKDNGNVNADLDPQGELAGKNVLSVHESVENVAATFGKSKEYIETVLSRGKIALREARAKRAPPAIDEKIITGWNGLTIGALARASWKLGRTDVLGEAVESMSLLFQTNFHHGELMRTSDGIPSTHEDYSYLISGLLDLYEATFIVQYLERARNLQLEAIKKFSDPRGGFYASQNWPWLIFRPKSGFDSAEPSSNGVALSNLVRLGRMTQTKQFFDEAEKLIGCYSADIKEQPMGYLSMLQTVLNDAGIYAIIGDGDMSRHLPAINAALSRGASVIKVDKDSVHFFDSLEEQWENASEVEFVAI